MAQRELGKTGLKAFPLGLGTVKLGRNRDVKYPGAFKLPTDAEVAELLELALSLGINFWDTAPAYGNSEERLGPWVRRYREQIVLCTKAGEHYDAGGSHFDFSAAAITASLEQSLRNLGTDHVDLLMLHSDGRDAEILRDTDALEGLARLKASGKVRASGISAKTADGILLGAKELDAVMAPFSAANPSLGSALKAASDAGCATLAIKTLGQGHGLRADDEDPAGSALAHVLRSGIIDVAVVGTRNPDHLRHAADAAHRALESTP